MNRKQALKELEGFVSVDSEQTRYLFEKEVGSNKKRLCYLFTFSEFLDAMEKHPSDRFWNECIFGYKPCKLYMDCEKKGNDLSVLDYVNEIQKQVVELLHPKEISFPLVFSACREGKFSVHLIWSDVWFPNAIQVGTFVKQIEQVMNVSIDSTVYPHNHYPAFLRMPFNKKRCEFTSNLLPIPSEPFTVDSFCSGLITFHSAMCPSKLKPIGIFQAVPIPPLPFIPPENSLETTKVMDDVIEFMSKAYPLFSPMVKTMKSDGTFSFYTKFYCKIANRWHANNNTSVYSDIHGNIFAYCMDEDCKVPIKLDFTVHTVVMSKSMFSLSQFKIQKI
jgi:hypothetical protein